MFENIPVGVDVDATVELSSIGETTTAFGRKIEKLQQLVNDKRDALRTQRATDIDRAGLVATENGTRTVDKDRRYTELQAIERNINFDACEYRNTLVESTKAEREAMLKSLSAKMQRLDALEGTFPNSAAFLQQHGLGTERHANLVKTFEGAGKAELTARAQAAVLSGDKTTASALATVINRLDKRDRPFAAIELADKLVGTEHQALLTNIANARDSVKAAMELDSLFTGKGESPSAKIERGLRQRAAQRRNAA